MKRLLPFLLVIAVISSHCSSRYFGMRPPERTGNSVKPDLPFDTDTLADHGIQSDTGVVSDSRTTYRRNSDTTPPEPEPMISNVGAGVNSTFPELMPIVTPDGQRLYFTRRDDPQNMGPGHFDDIWYSDRDSAGWGPAHRADPPLNNDHTNTVCSVTPDGNTLLLLGTYDESRGPGVYLSHRIAGGWSQPTSVVIADYYNLDPNNEFCLSNDGRYLLMTVRRNDSYGERDIYVSARTGDSSFSRPVNLGPTINTPEDELSPFLASDESTLYFASRGHGGFGSSDIFVAHRLDSTWTQWSDPVNLGAPINTRDWDAYFTLPASGDYALLVSASDSYGGPDIFSATLPARLRPRPVVLVSGRVRDHETGEPIGARIVYRNAATGQTIGTARSDPATGAYKLTLPGGADYALHTEQEGYMGIDTQLDLDDVAQYREDARDLFMVPLRRGQLLPLGNLFFEYATTTLVESSRASLRELVAVMKQNPTMQIDIQGHTDSVGTAEDNQQLSLRRALMVAAFLYRNAIGSERVTVHGYGELDPRVPNDNEEHMAENRRVDVVVRQP